MWVVRSDLVSAPFSTGYTGFHLDGLATDPDEGDKT